MAFRGTGMLLAADGHPSSARIICLVIQLLVSYLLVDSQGKRERGMWLNAS